MGTVLNRMKNQFSDLHFCLLWLIVLTIYGDTAGLVCSSVSPTEVIKSLKVATFRGKMRNEMKRMKNQLSNFLFLRYGRFCTEIQILLYVREAPPSKPLSFLCSKEARF